MKVVPYFLKIMINFSIKKKNCNNYCNSKILFKSKLKVICIHTNLKSIEMYAKV